MRHLNIIAILFLLASSVAHGQGFGGAQISNEFSPTANQLLLGGGGAWVINKHFYLGGAGYVSLNTITTGQEDTLSLGYGGLVLGYIHQMEERRSLGFDMMIGHGGSKINNIEYDFFVVEPNIKFWYQFSNYLFGTLGIYYRMAYPQAEATFKSNELNRLGIRLTLNFGSLK